MINKAKWITAGKDVTAPCIYKNFIINKPIEARLSITGLGYFICKINGKEISQDKFMPVFSDYRKRDFSNLLYPCAQQDFKHRVYYLDFDVTPLIRDGENVIEVFLGNGWYNQTERTVEGKLSFDNSLITKFVLYVNNADNTKTTIFSDGNEFWLNTHVVFNNIFYGETQDFTKIDNTPKPVEIYPDFDTEFTLQTCPNERVIRTIKPRKIIQKDGFAIYDIGENITGWAKLTLTGKTNVTVTYAGKLDDNGELDALTTGSNMQNDRGENQLQTDRYLTDGTAKTVNPTFTRHCFRYFKVQGDISNAIVEVVHTDNKIDSKFNCSNEVINWLYDAFIRTELDNMHDGFPSDCPHRERLGYTGDGQITALSSMLTLDAKDFYLKWMQDIADCQNLKNGYVHHTAPYMGGGGGPGGWSSAIVFVPYAFYKRYNDKMVVEKYLPNMLLWIDYMQNHSDKGLVVKAEEGHWCLGDWAFMEGKKIPEPFVNTTLFVLALENIKEMALAIGKNDIIDRLTAIIEDCKRAIVMEYYDAKTHRFCSGVQGADGFALQIGLGDDITAKALAHDYEQKGYYDTGFIGTYFLTKALFESGYPDVAFKLLSSKKVGSFGYMMQNGATTIDEHMSMGKYSSDCHPMFGAVTELLFTHILGLQVGNSKNYVIKPIIPSQLDYANGTISVDGLLISAGFIRQNGKIIYSAKIPNGFNAKLVYKNKQFTLYEGQNQIEL